MADLAAFIREVETGSQRYAPRSVFGAILRDGLIAALVTSLVRRVAQHRAG